jgi:hypothetical protein
MKRLIVFLALGFLLVPMVCFSDRMEVKEEKRYFSIPIEFTYSWRGSPTFNNMTGFPLEIRSVPRHKDDDWLRGNRFSEEPLPDTLLYLTRSWACDMSLFYTPKIFGLGVIVSFHSAGGEGSRYQQNQNGNSIRGTGSSLRWYELDKKGLSQVSLAGYLATPWVEIPYRDLCFRLKTGGVWDITGTRLVCNSGWDRWNSDEDWRDLELAKLYESRVFAALEAGFVLNKYESFSEYCYLQIMYYEPFYTIERLGSAPDLQFKLGRDRHLSLGFGLAF